MIKLGMGMLGVGVICCVALMTVLGPSGPCTDEAQTVALFGGLLCLAAGWIVGEILAVVALVVILINWGYPITYALTGKRRSAIPVLGGLCGALACLILPTGGTRWYWWLPLVVDVRCIGGLIAAVPVVIIRRLRP